MTPHQHAAKHPEIWRRFSPRQTLLRYAWYLGVVAIAVWSISAMDITWFFFLDAHVQALDMATRMWPPEVSYFRKLWTPLMLAWPPGAA